MPPIRSRDLPAYANRAGDPSFPPPYIVDDAGMDIFICEGDETSLGEMIDQALNVPTARQYGGRARLHFELADRHVGFACIDVKRLLSKPVEGNGVPSLVGLLGVTGIYANQTEVAVMVQVQDNTGMPYWYLPYVLNSLPTAVATGREIYGYPKQHAVFYADGKPNNGQGVLFGPDRKWKRRVGVHAYDIKSPKDGQSEFGLKNVLGFHRDESRRVSKIATEPLTTPRPKPEDFEFYAGSSSTIAEPSIATAEPAKNGLAATMSPSVVGRDKLAVARAFQHRVRSDVPYLFLRQFREPEREAFASYQALVLGRLVPDSADSLEIVDTNFTLVMPWAYNLALAKQLFNQTQKVTVPGIEPKTLRTPVVGVLSGKNATFSVLRATVLWQYNSGLVKEPPAKRRNAEIFQRRRTKPPRVGRGG